MLEAAFWGCVGGIALVIGGLIALRAPLSTRSIGLIMGFGAGVLVSAVAYELVADAFASAGGSGAIGLGLAVGALTFFAGEILIARRGHRRRRAAGALSTPDQADSDTQAEGGQAIALGAVLDGIPESIVIGTSLLGGAGVSVAMVVAVFVSNLPESIAATVDQVQTGTPPGQILRMWFILTAVFGVAAALGYGIVGVLPVGFQAFVQAFAGGALLTMLGNSMIPEAYDRARRWAGLCLVLGFALAFALSAL